jgi:small basic protein
MNWLIIISNISFASIAALLCVIGWSTLKTIKHLNVGKSFWIPIFMAGLLFTVSSIITILNDAFLSLTVAVEIGQITQLIAIIALSASIYNYSRTIRRNIPETYILSEAGPLKDGEFKAQTVTASRLDERKKIRSKLRTETIPGCNHEIGYLSTLPLDTSLPEECLSCSRIIECKQ